MANEEHLKILKQGIDVWNEWRQDNPNEQPDLREANLSEADLSGVDLHRADLVKSDLSGANLRGANLTGADLTGANLFAANLLEANLSGANLIRAHFIGADLSGVILNDAQFDYTTLANLDLRTANGLETVIHEAPSIIGVDTLARSHGDIPDEFLRGAGVPEIFIQYLPSLTEQPIQFYSAFISYSHKDKPFARRLYDALQARGIRCWLDEHQLLPGDKIHAEVDRGIRLWDKILLCCSKHSLNSWWVNNEISLAMQKEQSLSKERGEEVLALIPLNLDGYMFKGEWNSGLKGQLTGRLAPDFTGWQHSPRKFEEQVDRLVRALRISDAAYTTTTIEPARGEATLTDTERDSRPKSFESGLSDIRAAVDSASHLLDLKPNWNGEDSPGYSRDTLRKAADFVRATAVKAWVDCGVRIPAPTFEAGPDGSIDIHWEVGGSELLLNIPANEGMLAEYYGDNNRGEKIKGVLDISSSNEWLMSWLAK